MEIPDILERVRRLGCSLVEVTGGEPLIQKETPSLIGRLLGEGHTVLLETNGSIDISGVDRRCARIVDIKCPSSAMAGQNDLRNLKRLRARDELKFVIGNRQDYEFAKDLLSTLPAARLKINLSPVFGALAPRSLAEWILDDRLPVRLNLQLHKIIWDPEARGV
jgi:7-carboxy-7-deazaguanine synthase